MANAERIVACVNGCAGIDPAAAPDLLAALSGIVDSIAPWMEHGFKPNVDVAIRIARAAIDKAKGTP